MTAREDRDPAHGSDAKLAEEVEEEIDSLPDVESSPTLPSGALAMAAAVGRNLLGARPADREIWSLAWPVILSQSLVSLVSLVDIAMVGRLGRESVAAVGYVTQYLWLTQSILFAVGIACVALMARAIGGGRVERAREAFSATLVVAFTIAAGMTILCLSIPGPLLRLLGASDSVTALGVPYLRLVLASTLLLAGAITIESAMRAARDTRTPMWIVGIVTVVKTALNALLIFGMAGFPRLELMGAGWATLIAQSVGLALFVTMALRARDPSPLRLRRADLRGSRNRLREVVRLSVPAVGERVVMNFAMMAYFAVLGRYGTAALAAYTIGIRVLSFSWIPGIGFSTAAATLVGQSLGAGDRAGAEQAGWRSVRMAVTVSLGLGLLYAVFRVPVAKVFTNDASVIAELGPFMLILALVQPFMGLHFTLGGALRGAGDTMTPLVAATVGNWVLRVPIAVACAAFLHGPVLWVWLALVGDHLARALWLGSAFRAGRWAKVGDQLDQPA